MKLFNNNGKNKLNSDKSKTLPVSLQRKKLTLSQIFQSLLPVVKKHSRFVGIDVQESCLRLLEISQGQTTEIKSIECVNIPKISTTEVDPKNVEILNNAVLALVNKVELTSNQAAMAVNGLLILTKEVSLFNSGSIIDLEKQVWLETKKIFPAMADNISLDFHVCGINEKDEQKIDVLLIACRNDIIQERINSLADTGLQLKVMDVNYYALIRAYSFLAYQLPLDIDSENNTVAILNFDGAIATLIVLENQIMTFSKELVHDIKPIDNWLTNIISGHEHSLGEAEINAHTANVAQKIHQTMQFFYTTKINKNIDYLFLAGEHATLPNIANITESITKTKTLIADPFAHMRPNKNLTISKSALEKISPAFTLACGLAARGIEND